MPLKQSDTKKLKLHPRNKNRDRYNLAALLLAVPQLKQHIKPNKFGIDSINFSNPIAVKLLNKALLNYYYGIKNWDFPKHNLCPPIPGRADYIHYIADLLGEFNSNKIPMGQTIKCLDIGTGASCIYPIIGVSEYGWNFIASDIDSKSVASAQNIVNTNATLKGKISCKLQNKATFFFRGIINKKDKITISMCNPPFHSSIEEAMKGTRRKVKNLTGKKLATPQLNFSGNSNELVYNGGELQFIQNMIFESKSFSQNCFWFTTLVSKESNLKSIYKTLKKVKPTKIKTIEMCTGNKISRIVAWTYLSALDLQEWQA